jgi:hypothetical protein
VKNAGDRLLPEILELTQQMLRDASDEEWAQLQLLEQRRRKLIAACFPLDGPVSEPRQAADQIRQIIETGEMVAELASTARDGAGNALGELKQRRTATRAYRLVGG